MEHDPSVPPSLDWMTVRNRISHESAAPLAQEDGVTAYHDEVELFGMKTIPASVADLVPIPVATGPRFQASVESYTTCGLFEARKR